MPYRLTENDRDVIVTGDLAVTVPAGVLEDRTTIMHFDYRYRIPIPETLDPADEAAYVAQQERDLNSRHYLNILEDPKAHGYLASRTEPVN